MSRHWRSSIIVGLALLACDKPARVEQPPQAARVEQPPLSDLKVCTLIGCSSGFFLRTQVDASLAQLRSSSLTLCRNDSCQSLSFAGIAEADGRIVPHRVSHPKNDDIAKGQPRYEALVFPEAEGGFRLDVTYSPASIAELKDGDSYVVTVQTGEGRKLTEIRRTVVYEELWPNGPSCPPPCRQARLD
jgi:hypothetical protein